jgi:hypothetical protein
MSNVTTKYYGGSDETLVLRFAGKFGCNRSRTIIELLKDQQMRGAITA